MVARESILTINVPDIHLGFEENLKLCISIDLCVGRSVRIWPDNLLSRSIPDPTPAVLIQPPNDHEYTLRSLIGLPQTTPRRTAPETLAQLRLHRSGMYADGHSGLPPLLQLKIESVYRLVQHGFGSTVGVPSASFVVLD